MSAPHPKNEDLPNGGPKRPEDLLLLRMFRGVAPEHLQAAFAALEQRRLRSRAMLRLDQEFKDKVGFAWGGAYRFCTATPGGETITLYPIQPPHGFGYAMAVEGFEFGDIHRLAVDRGGQLLALPRPVFLDLAHKSPVFAANLNRALARLTLRYSARIYEFAASSVRVRLQSELLRRGEQAAVTTDRRALVPSPTHATLADLVGATREAVSRHLRALADDGVIELHRRLITIVSMRALRDLDARALGRRFTPPTGD